MFSKSIPGRALLPFDVFHLLETAPCFFASSTSNRKDQLIFSKGIKNGYLKIKPIL
jgi:hypothetical protein